MKKAILLFLLCVSVFCFAGEDAMRYKLVPLGDIPFETVRKLSESWRSPGGTLFYEKDRHAALLYDTDAVISKFQRMTEDLRPALPNIRVTVTCRTAEPSVRRNLSLPDRRFPVKKGGAGGGLSFSSGFVSSSDMMIVVTMSGRPATIWKGKNIVDPQWLAMQEFIPERVFLSGDTTILLPGADFKNVRWTQTGAKLMVLPVLDAGGKSVTVTLYPRIAYVEGKTKAEQAVAVKSLSATVTVPLGRTITIGGILSSRADDYVNLFGPGFLRSGAAGSVTDFTLRCDLLP